MGSFLERYERGESEQVWTELIALGQAVREEPVYSDALAVAHETMRRARENIERLIPRLVAVGYQFGYGWVQPFVRERLLGPYRVAYPGQYGQVLTPRIPERFPFGYRADFAERLEMAASMPPLFAAADDREEQIAQLEHNIAATTPVQHALREQLRATRGALQSKPSAQALVAELEALTGPLPLSLRAWYEVVGGVSFVGDSVAWRALLPETVTTYPMDEYDYLNPMFLLDPLLVRPLDEAVLARYRSRAGLGQASQSRVPLAVGMDPRMKYLDNGGPGGYQIVVPALEADAPFVPGGQMFVTYLRECFQWGGFPGWARQPERPDSDLAFLTHDLRPL
ncbi:MAG TPA: hypothetical protein VIC85_18385 [Ktedonobacterales bacterium]